MYIDIAQRAEAYCIAQFLKDKRVEEISLVLNKGTLGFSSPTFVLFPLSPSILPPRLPRFRPLPVDFPSFAPFLFKGDVLLLRFSIP